MTSEYTERLVAYLDILGWKHACERETPDLLLDAIRKLHDDAASFSESERKFVRKLEAAGRGHANPLFLAVRVGAFSDNIVVSMPISLGTRIFNIGATCARLLAAGFLTRGVVTAGKLYHEDNIVFGPALNRAVDLEKETKLPRVLCDESVVNLLATKPGFAASVTMDHEGMRIINPYQWPFDPRGAPDLARQIILDNWRLPAVIEHVRHNISSTEGDVADKWAYMRRLLKESLFGQYDDVMNKYLETL